MRAQLAAVLLVGSALFMGCSSKNRASGTTDPAVSVREVGVAEVATFVRDKSATIVDANGADTRKEFGIIPGAVLLTSSRDYPVDVLPSAKASKLVFYCGGVMCRASDKAAARAAAAGYTDVNVLRDGIKGWKNSGQPTEMPRS